MNLPYAHAPRPRNGARRKSGFRLREVDQLLRDAFFGEDLLNHRTIAARMLQPVRHNFLAAGRRKEVDEADDRIVLLQWKLRGGRADLFLHLVSQVRVDREGHVEQVVDGRLLEGDFGLRTVRGSSAIHVIAVNRLDKFLGMPLQPSPGRLWFREPTEEFPAPDRNRASLPPSGRSETLSCRPRSTRRRDESGIRHRKGGEPQAGNSSGGELHWRKTPIPAVRLQYPAPGRSFASGSVPGEGGTKNVRNCRADVIRCRTSMSYKRLHRASKP